LKLGSENCFDILGIGREDDPDILEDMELTSIRACSFNICARMLKEIFPELCRLVSHNGKGRMNGKVKT